MDSTVGEILLFAMLLVVLLAPLAGILVWMWRRSPQDARKQLDKTLEAGGVEFSPPTREGLERQFTHLMRWSMIGSFVPIFMLSWLAQRRPTSWEFVAVLLVLLTVSAGISIGSVLSTVRRSHRELSTRRVATLTPRTVRSYLHPLELGWFALAPVMGTGGLALILMSKSESSTEWPVPLVGSLLMGLGVAVALLQRHLVRLPLRARDDEERLAYNLLVAVALRHLLAGVLVPVTMVDAIAWMTVVEAEGQLPRNGYLLAGILVALLVMAFLTPAQHRRQHVLWRFRQQDQRVPA